MSLDDLNIKKLSTKNFDLKNSIAYILDDEIILDLVGTNKYENYYLCGSSYAKDDIIVQDTTCDTEHTLVYIDFKVDLDGGDTNQIFNTKYLSGNYLILQIPYKENYSFKKWEIVSGNNELDQNRIRFGSESTEIKATWTINPTLFVDLNGGTTEQKFKERYVASTTITLEEPIRSGYPFKGWKLTDGNSLLSGNILTIGNLDTIVEAIWEVNDYTITYNLDGGSVSNNPANYTIESDNIVLNNPSKIGHTFIGWTGSNGNNPEKTIIISNGTIGNKTYIANYMANTYTISYELNGGTKGANFPTSATYGSTVTVSNPTRSNYMFTGWSVLGTGASMSGTNLTIGAGNVTLTANRHINNKIPAFTYSGSYQIVNDSDTAISTSTGNWKIRFLTSGTLKFTDLSGASSGIDVFLVGSGAGGSSSASANTGGGGGGSYMIGDSGNIGNASSGGSGMSS